MNAFEPLSAFQTIRKIRMPDFERCYKCPAVLHVWCEKGFFACQCEDRTRRAIEEVETRKHEVTPEMSTRKTKASDG